MAPFDIRIVLNFLKMVYKIDTQAVPPTMDGQGSRQSSMGLIFLASGMWNQCFAAGISPN